jgi:hypothetical protein
MSMTPDAAPPPSAGGGRTGVRVSVVLTDRANSPIPGVGGPLQGVTGLSYTPEGCVLDGIGYVRFKIPLTVRRNTLVVPGTHVQVFEDNYRAAWGVVTAKSETISDDGVFAQFDCPDLLYLLQKLTVTSGFATAPGETVATTLARLLALDARNHWLAFSDLFDPATGATAYDGIPFSQQGGNIAGALTKYAGERFSHAKRGIGLSIEFGQMGTKATFVAAAPDPTTTLAAAIATPAQATIAVASAAGFPIKGTFTIKVGAEVMVVTAGQGTTTWTVQRGAAPVAHAAGTAVTGLDVGVTTARLVAIAGAGVALPAAQRQIDLTTLAHTKDGQVVNDTAPVGSDNGVQQLTLRTLYNPSGEAARRDPTTGLPDGSYQSGPVAFAGYNPVYPICRRPSASGATWDGYDYFLRDEASVAAYDLAMDEDPKANIAPVKNAAGGISPADMQLAAVALYQWGVARLLWAAQPQETIACSTAGYADVRDFAGKRVEVYVKRQLPDGTDVLAIDLQPIVTRVEVAWGDAGDPTYRWELSTNGKQAGSIGNLVLGKIAQLDQQGYATPVFPVPIYMPKSQNIGPGADLVLNFPARNNVTAVQSMLLFLTLEGMVHTRDDQGHTQDVVTTAMPHDVNALPHDVAAVPHDVNFAHAANYEFRVGGANFSVAGVDYDPHSKLHIAAGTPSGGAKVLMFDPGTDNFYFQSGGSRPPTPRSPASTSASRPRAPPPGGRAGR